MPAKRTGPCRAPHFEFPDLLTTHCCFVIEGSNECHRGVVVLDLQVDSLVDELVAGVCKRLALVPGVEGAVDFYRERIRDNSLSPDDLRFGGPNNAVNTRLYHIDAIYHFMPDQKFVPFVVAGVGGAHFDPNSTGDKNKLMADVGVDAKYWLTDNTALRMDIRGVAYIGNLKQNLEATLGLVIALGGKGKPAPPPPQPQFLLRRLSLNLNPRKKLSRPQQRSSRHR